MSLLWLYIYIYSNIHNYNCIYISLFFYVIFIRNEINMFSINSSFVICTYIGWILLHAVSIYRYTHCSRLDGRFRATFIETVGIVGSFKFCRRRFQVQFKRENKFNVTLQWYWNSDTFVRTFHFEWRIFNNSQASYILSSSSYVTATYSDVVCLQFVSDRLVFKNTVSRNSDQSSV